MDEFELIEKYFAQLTPTQRLAAKGVRVGVGDDAALLRLQPGEELAVTTDMLVSGRHFSESADPADIGWKSLAVNVSDLAAMGAEPRAFTLALSLQSADPEWLQGFSDGLRAAAQEMDIALIGGDLTRGPLTIAITAMGAVAEGRALRRNGARVGDRVGVTGPLGDAALALYRRERGLAEVDSLAQRLDRPMPRVQAGMGLRGLAHAALDISDGLAGDLAHVLRASGVGACLDADRLPASPAFLQLAPPGQRLALQLGGGDDYELCCCIPPASWADAVARLAPTRLHDVGVIEAQPGLRLRDGQGRVTPYTGSAYRHFS